MQLRLRRECVGYQIELHQVHPEHDRSDQITLQPTTTIAVAAVASSKVKTVTSFAFATAAEYFLSVLLSAS
jgi:hypothetical protein